MKTFQLYNAGLKKLKPVSEINLEDYVGLIKNDTITELVQERYRTSMDESEKKSIKLNELKYVTPQVLVTERKESGIVKRTGLLIGDIDKIDDVELVFEKLKSDNHTLILHRSISGKGLRVFVKVDVEQSEHFEYFNAYSNYLHTTYRIKLDKACKDLVRASLLSNDKSIYYNSESIELEGKFVDLHSINSKSVKKQQHKEISTNEIFPVVKPFSTDSKLISDYTEKYINNLMRKMLKCEEGEKHNTLLKEATWFGSLVYYGVVEYQKAIDSLKQAIEQRSATVVDMESAIQTLKHGVEYGYNNPIDISKWVVFDKNRFWDYNFGKNNSVSFTIQHLKVQNLLMNLGMSVYKKGSVRMLVHKHNNIIEGKEKMDIVEMFNKHVKSLPQSLGFYITVDCLKEKILRSQKNMFTDMMLYGIECETFDFQKDTQYVSYQYFQNKFVEVTDKGIEIKDYSLLQNPIWKSKIKQRTIEEYNYTFDEVKKKGEFAQFLYYVSDKNEDRFMYICTLIGYLLHEYKNPSKSRAVILMDNIDDFDSPNGGTGKGIIIEALKHFLKVATLDGKTFSFKSEFKYQLVDVDTKLVVFEDVAEYFQFEKLFSIITDSFPVNKKNVGEFTLEKSESPKVLISSNYPILGEGESHERRKYVFVLSNYFHQKNTPEMVFGHLLFDGWDTNQWNYFNWFMLHCIKLYLEKGVLKYEEDQIEISLQKLKYQTNESFVSFMLDETIIEKGVFYATELFQKFIQNHPEWKNLEHKRFIQWIKIYFSTLDDLFNSTHTYSNNRLKFEFNQK